MIDLTSRLTPPAQNSTANGSVADVIGNKTDNYNGNSIYSFSRMQHAHTFTESKVYPTLAAGATVVSANADWTLGAYAVIVPASTITVPFHIHNVAVETCDQNAIFELALFKGAGDDLIATVRFAVVGGFWGNSVYVIASEDIEANSQVRAKLASSDGALNQATMTISVCYCEET